MKLFISAFGAETNSFVDTLTTIEDFERTCLIRPGETIDHHIANNGHNVFIDLARKENFDIEVGTLAYAKPSGALQPQTYKTLRDEIIGQLRKALPVDIVILNLHGAMLSLDCDDCEGDLLEHIKKIVPKNTIVSALLDPHAHLSSKMVKNSDLLCAYHEYPHTDFAERARTLFALSIKAAKKQIDPQMSVYDCRCIGSYPTTKNPMRRFVDEYLISPKDEEVLDCSLIHSFPWGDTPDLGTKVLALSHKSVAAAQNYAKEVGEHFRDIYDETAEKLIPLDDLSTHIRESESTPVIIGDFCDNPGGGAPGDSTFVLQKLIDDELDNVAFGFLHDPLAVEIAFKAGAGSKINLRIGGKFSRFSGSPLDLEVEVISLSESVKDRFGEDQDVVEFDLGRCARLRHKNIDIFLRETRDQTYSPDGFVEMGLSLQNCQAVIVKSSNHFKSAFRLLSDNIITVNSPASLNMDIASIPYKHSPIPVLPLDRHSRLD